MALKRVIKKEYLLICIILGGLAYFTEPTRLEFLIYQNFQPLLTFLIASLLTLITICLVKNVVYKALNRSVASLRSSYLCSRKAVTFCSTVTICLVRNVVYKALNWSVASLRSSYLCSRKLLRGLYFRSKKIVILCSTRVWKKLVVACKETTAGVKDVLDIKQVIPEKKDVTESFSKLSRNVKRKEFWCKWASVASFNILVACLLIKGWVAESNSITIPTYSELEFVAHRLVINKIIPVMLSVLRHTTLHNILLTACVILMAYLVGIKKLREGTKTLFSITYQATVLFSKETALLLGTLIRNLSKKSKAFKAEAKSIVYRRTWRQIKEEATILKEELSIWEVKKKLLALATMSFIIIILISGSLSHENNLWTSFVAATAGELCDGVYDYIALTYRRCEASETCCSPGGKICSTAQAGGYQCYNAAGGGSCGGLSCNYDNDEGACDAAYSTWWCDATTSGTACDSGKYTTKTNNPWTWGAATTIGYESGTAASCCGDDTGTPEYYKTCNKESTVLWGCTSSDKGCCKATTKCVDPYIPSPATVPNCYATGSAYKITNVGSGEDRFAVCSGNVWYECDTNETNCETYCVNAGSWPLQGSSGGANSWAAGGESAPFGEYTGTETECCGEDTNEYYTPNAGDWSDSTKACCDAESDCVGGSTCYTTANCRGTTPDYYCNSGAWQDSDTSSTTCTTCTYKWYSSLNTCCGDDGTSDDFYTILSTGSPDVCMSCNDGANSSTTCIGDTGCDANGWLMWTNATGNCTEGPDCTCFINEDCASTGYTNVTISGTVTDECTLGGVYDDQYSNCFTDRVGDNSTCRYATTDPCVADSGLTLTTSTACADEGGESADGWYCYYDEGCSTSGPNSTCTDGKIRPACDAGSMTGTNANCEKDNPGEGIDVCLNNTGDACAADDDGWDFTNDSWVNMANTVQCTTCDSDYQADFDNNLCFYAVSCTTNGWSSSNENCYTWCWGGDLTTADCFGSQTVINRTEPANQTDCYFSRTCTDSVNGCGWAFDIPMRQDFCDQCGPTQTYNATDYCPPINASCYTNCANSGDIWYGSDSVNRCSNTNCLLTKDTLTIGDVWGGNNSAAWCDDAECNLDCKASGNAGGDCDNGVCVCSNVECDQGCLYIRNSTEDNVSIFTYTGNMFIAGNFLTSIGAPDGSDFIIRDSSNNNEAWIDNVNGGLRIAGTLFENKAAYCTTVAGDAFIVDDKSENCVAYINSTGDLWLRGNLTRNANI